MTFMTRLLEIADDGWLWRALSVRHGGSFQARGFDELGVVGVRKHRAGRRQVNHVGDWWLDFVDRGSANCRQVVIPV
jgi:hypothetical protein